MCAFKIRAYIDLTEALCLLDPLQISAAAVPSQLKASCFNRLFAAPANEPAALAFVRTPLYTPVTRPTICQCIRRVWAFNAIDIATKFKTCNILTARAYSTTLQQATTHIMIFGPSLRHFGGTVLWFVPVFMDNATASNLWFMVK